MKTYSTLGLGMIAMAATALLFTACAKQHTDDKDWSASEKNKVEQMASQSKTYFKQRDPSLQRFFDSSVGYVIFPEITAGGAGIGAAYGEGVLYQNGRPVGYATLTQGTIGATLGGKTYSEIIFFETPLTMSKFKKGELEFSASVSGVAASKGAAKTADYSDGVAVFITSQQGLMGDASVGGQQFEYWPKY